MNGTRCRVLAALSDTRWLSTREIADTAQVSTELAIHHLKHLEGCGLAVRRGTRRLTEWCWVPGGYPHSDLVYDADAATI
jgi:predicted transcriptional regulator